MSEEKKLTGRKRIFEIARFHGVSSQDILDFLRDIHVENVTSHYSIIDTELVRNFEQFKPKYSTEAKIKEREERERKKNEHLSSLDDFSGDEGEPKEEKKVEEPVRYTADPLFHP